jgi:DNA-binding IclR family transcriptional regulator
VQPRESITSVENALLLLSALHERGQLRVSEAARLLSVAPATAHRLLSTLKLHGFAEQDRQRAYRPGPRMRALADGGASLPDLSIVAHPHLVALTEKTRETTHLVTLEGNGCRFIDGVESPLGLRVGRRVGLLLPAHTTSGGKVLLAQLSDSEVAALYPQRRVQMRDGSTRDLATMRRELATVRRQGHALNLELSERGVNAIGVPVTNQHGRVLASVVLACPSVRSTRAILVGHLSSLQETAAAIAAALP